MAATVQAALGVSGVPFLVTEVQVSTIVPGVGLDIAHGGPSGVKPKIVVLETTTRAASRDPVTFVHDPSADNTTNNTARVYLDTVAGGDLTDAVVKLYFFFFAQATGGIS